MESGLLIEHLVGKVELRLDLSKSFWENIGVYHERLKKLHRKLKRMEDALEKLEREHFVGKKGRKLVRRRQRDWYEKFRWMLTRSGFLVIGGRDARSNELIVRKYLAPSDLFFHADISGAPAVVLKEGKRAGEDDIRAAAQFAAVYSRAWRERFAALDVFYVAAEQVSLAPPSGEYRPKGGVMVYGKKHWVRKVPLFLFVGFDDEKNRPFVSVTPCERCLKIVPGKIDKNDAAKLIIKRLSMPDTVYQDLLALLPPGSLDVIPP